MKVGEKEPVARARARRQSSRRSTEGRMSVMFLMQYDTTSVVKSVENKERVAGHFAVKYKTETK